MSEELHTYIEPQLEARITALVLGEASDFEIDELERLIQEKPELAIFHRRLQMMHELLGEAMKPEPDESWQLSDARRAKLRQVFAEQDDQPTKVRSSVNRVAQWRSAVGIAACLLVCLVLFAFMAPLHKVGLDRSPKVQAHEAEIVTYSGAAKGKDEEKIGDLPVTGRLFRNENGEGKKSQPSSPSSSMSKVIAANGVVVPVPDFSDTTLTFGNGDDFGDGWGVGSKDLDDDESGGSIRDRASRQIARRSSIADEVDKPQKALLGDRYSYESRQSEANHDKVAQRKVAENESRKSDDTKPFFGDTRAGLLQGVDNQWDVELESKKAKPVIIAKPSMPFDSLSAGETDEGFAFKLNLQEKDLEVGRDQESIDVAGSMIDEALAEANKELQSEGQGENTVRGVDDLRRNQRNDGKVKNTSQSSLREGLQKKSSEVTAAQKQGMEKMHERLDEQVEQNSPVTRSKPKPLPDETHTLSQPFSTFSLNVSDVSFKLAKAALLENGQWPDAAKVRTEEFVNAFNYGDASPLRGERVACAIEQSTHPFMQQRNLLRIGMKTASVGRSAPLRLTILLDNSGSMEREDREASVLAAMQVLAQQLGPQDVITLVGFASKPRLLADRISGDKAGNLVDIVANTPSEGGTNLEEALRLARTLALRQHTDGAQDRVVLITDGVANLGNVVPEELSQEIETMRQLGIAFDACGVGAEGLNDDILEALTRKGDGRYYFLNRAEDADQGFAKQLAGALNPAAKNVKVQVKFNSNRVTKYRLLGFEKHLLNKKDFRNDKIDAAEMSAEEAGNAVYQIEVNPEGYGELGEVFVRFLDVSTGRMVERSWPLPYEPQADAFDLATPSMQLAGTAAMLGEKLHATDGGSVSFEMIAETLGKLRAHYSSDAKVQDLIRMCEKVK